MKYKASRQTITKKDRRHSGRYWPKATTNDPEAQVYIQEEYDDWQNYRDGFRDWEGDGKRIVNLNRRYPFSNKVRHMNKKNKRLLKRKKLRRKKHDLV